MATAKIPSSSPINTPVVLNVTRDQIPDGVEALHNCAVKGMADSYNELQTGGVVARVDVIDAEAEIYPELTGIVSIWLMYRNPSERKVIVL